MLAYTTGVINEANAATVAQTMAGQIRDDLVAHAAWELVEEFTPSTGTVNWCVLKCLATESGLPSDFYAVIGRTLATGELRFAIGEGYNAATNTLSGFAPIATGSVAYDSNGCNPATYVLGTGPFSGFGDTPMYLGWVPSGVSTKWWLVAAEDGFTVAFNGAVNEFVHLGAYIPLTGIAIDLPLQIMGSAQNDGGITRNPSVAGTNVSGLSLEMQGGGSPNSNIGPSLGFRGDLRYNDHLQGDQRAVAEQGISMYLNTNSPTVYGWALGKQKRMRVGGGQVPSGFVWGDAYDLGGELWVPYKPDDLRIWETGVSA